MLRNIFAFGWPSVIGAVFISALSMALPLEPLISAVLFAGVYGLTFVFINLIFYEEIYRFFHRKPDLPEYTIFRFWGSTAPIEYRIEQLLRISLVNQGGFLPNLKWEASYTPVHGSTLLGELPWTSKGIKNVFTEYHEAKEALKNMIFIKQTKEAKEAAERASKEKPGPVSAFNPSSNYVEAWAQDVIYIST